MKKILTIVIIISTLVIAGIAINETNWFKAGNVEATIKPNTMTQTNMNFQLGSLIGGTYFIQSKSSILTVPKTQQGGVLLLDILLNISNEDFETYFLNRFSDIKMTVSINGNTQNLPIVENKIFETRWILAKNDETTYFYKTSNNMFNSVFIPAGNPTITISLMGTIAFSKISLDFNMNIWFNFNIG